jgi:hypothetical protein
VATYTRRHDEVLTAVDTLGLYPDPPHVLPRKVHIRHVHPNPAVVLQFRDWSNNRTAVIPPTGPTDGNVPILRMGRTVSLLSEIFGGWTEYPKGHIAQLMNSGLIEVHDDYLGTTRQLSSGQVLQYQIMDNPWIEYVPHRTKTGTVDDVDPALNTVGTIAAGFNKVKAKMSFTGGTAPSADMICWHRSAVAEQPRGAWVKDGSYTGVLGNEEVEFQAGYGEVYVQLLNIGGTPTSVEIELSGCAG